MNLQVVVLDSISFFKAIKIQQLILDVLNNIHNVVFTAKCRAEYDPFCGFRDIGEPATYINECTAWVVMCLPGACVDNFNFCLSRREIVVRCFACLSGFGHIWTRIVLLRLDVISGTFQALWLGISLQSSQNDVTSR